MSSRRQLSNIPSQPQQQTIGIPYAIIYLRKLSTTRSHSTNQCTNVYNINWNRKKHASRKFQRKSLKVSWYLVPSVPCPFFSGCEALFLFLPRWTEPCALQPESSPLFRSCFKPSVHDMCLILRRPGPTLVGMPASWCMYLFIYSHTHTYIYTYIIVYIYIIYNICSCGNLNWLT